MEFKTCEEYVLVELANAQNRISELEKLLEDRDLEIQALEMKLEDLYLEKELQKSNNLEQLDIYDFLDNGGFIKIE